MRFRNAFWVEDLGMHFGSTFSVLKKHGNVTEKDYENTVCTWGRGL
jgi:hypothetical protein